MAQSTVISASALVKTGRGRWYGFFCQSSNVGTVKVWDALTGAAGGRVLLDTTGAITAPFNAQLDNGVEFQTGLFVTIGGTAASLAVLWE